MRLKLRRIPNRLDIAFLSAIKAIFCVFRSKMINLSIGGERLCKRFILSSVAMIPAYIATKRKMLHGKYIIAVQILIAYYAGKDMSYHTKQYVQIVTFTVRIFKGPPKLELDRREY